MDDNGYNSKASLPQTKGTGPYRQQREKDASRDGKSKVSAMSGEHPALDANMQRVSSFLEKQDTMGEYHTHGAYGSDKKIKA